mgnify:CR=1 FL=1
MLASIVTTHKDEMSIDASIILKYGGRCKVILWSLQDDFRCFSEARQRWMKSYEDD